MTIFPAPQPTKSDDIILIHRRGSNVFAFFESTATGPDPSPPLTPSQILKSRRDSSETRPKKLVNVGHSVFDQLIFIFQDRVLHRTPGGGAASRARAQTPRVEAAHRSTSSSSGVYRCKWYACRRRFNVATTHKQSGSSEGERKPAALQRHSP